MNKGFRLSKNKFLELEARWDKDLWYSYFEFILCWTRCMDHAGPVLSLSLYRLTLSLHIYDTRHYEKKRFLDDADYREDEEACDLCPNKIAE